MTLPPLIERELRAALRKKMAGLRFWTAVIGAGITVAYLSLRSGSPTNSGQTLFHFLLFLSSASVFETVHLALDLIAMERRSGTLGLLILTGLSTGQIFLSKLAGAVVVQLSCGLALLPCFAVCFLLGGVPGSAFLAAAVLIPNLILFTLSTCLAASTLARDEDGAMMMAAGIGGLVCLLGPAVYYASVWLAPAPLDESWLLISPLWGVKLVWDFFRTGSLAQFWWNSAMTLAWWLTLAGIAAWVLRRTWREEAESPTFRLLWPSICGQEKGFSAEPSRADREWLSPNPFVWMALRDKRSVRMAWAGTIGIAALWGLGYCLAPRAWGSTVSALVGASALNAVVGMAAMFAAAKRVSEDRRNGALELMLTTSLQVEEIMDGQRQALALAFRQVWRWTLGMNACLAVAALAARPWDLLALYAFAVSWGIFACIVNLSLNSPTLVTVMWAALNSGRPLFVLRKVVCPPSALIGITFGAFQVVQSGWPREFPYGSPAELGVLTVILTGALVLSWFASMGVQDGQTQQLKKQFRLIAQRPLPEPTDPRFRKWDPARPFPEPRPFL